MAEGGHRGIITRAAPFAEEIREAVDQRLCAGLGGVAEKFLLGGQLALAVVRTGEPSEQGSLGGGGQQNRAAVAVPPQKLQNPLGEAQIAGHKFRSVLRPVDPGQMEDEIRPGAALLQNRFRRIQIVFPDGSDLQIPA